MNQSSDKSMRVTAGSSGSFLAPPGHPTLTYSIEAGPRQGTQRYDTHGPSLIAGLDYALENEAGDVPPAVQHEVRKLYDEATPVRSELWERNVYGYFRNCYSPDGIDRSASDCLIIGSRGVTADDPRCVPEHHLAFLLVKSYFPDAHPRPELLDPANTLYGQRPCDKCGTGCQYEASVDAFAEPVTAALACPAGGEHVVTIPPITTKEA